MMTLKRLDPQAKRFSTLSLCALGAALSSGCATTQMQTRLAPIPVAMELRAECVAPTLPADPVTATDMLHFSLAQESARLCERERANGLLATIDAHNRSAE